MTFEHQSFHMQRQHELSEKECVKIVRMTIRANHKYFAEKMAETYGYESDFDYLSALLGEALTEAMQEANWTVQDAIEVCLGQRLSCDLDDDIPF